MAPVAASIQMRPCLISASRAHVTPPPVAKMPPPFAQSAPSSSHLFPDWNWKRPWPLNPASPKTPEVCDTEGAARRTGAAMAGLAGAAFLGACLGAGAALLGAAGAAFLGVTIWEPPPPPREPRRPAMPPKGLPRAGWVPRPTEAGVALGAALGAALVGGGAPPCCEPPKRLPMRPANAPPTSAGEVPEDAGPGTALGASLLVGGTEPWGAAPDERAEPRRCMVMLDEDEAATARVLEGRTAPGANASAAAAAARSREALLSIF
mmetsp:Transcript_13991/g.27638  ORF Transcript_13991/g.27638 Transcript_13991/m.27638 type:complete len:264 (-) Transcript_13991:20-811(-)